MYFRTGNPKGLAESGSGELGIIVCDRGRQTEEIGMELRIPGYNARE